MDCNARKTNNKIEGLISVGCSKRRERRGGRRRGRITERGGRMRDGRDRIRQSIITREINEETILLKRNKKEIIRTTEGRNKIKEV
jgi:hypothetical protein